MTSAWPSTRRRLLSGVWVALALLTGAIGYHRLAHESADLPKVVADRDGTTDTWLQVLEIPHPAQAVREALAEIPQDQALVIVASPASTPKLTEMVLSMLAWPRPVAVVSCDADHPPRHPPRLLLPPNVRIGAVLLYRYGDAYSHMAVGTTPTVHVGDTDLTSRGIGPALEMIIGTETTTWPSYCSF